MGEPGGSTDLDLETIRNPDVEFESRDLSLGVIGLVAIGIALLLTISPLALLLGFWGITGDVNRKLTIHPPAPQLQVHPASDLQAELQRQRTFLNSYAWVDQGRKTARVPIAVAMKQLVATGIDGFPAASTQPSAAQPNAGQSSSGAAQP